jgi:hypothetical protein
MHEIIESEMYMDAGGTVIVMIRSVVEEGRDVISGTVLIG